MYDVGPSHPGGEEAPKGSAVRRLKRYASWVQNVVRQWEYRAVYKFGYLLESLMIFVEKKVENFTLLIKE